jgi:hypothetical protein
MSFMQRSRAIAATTQRALMGRVLLVSGLLLIPALLLLLISP